MSSASNAVSDDGSDAVSDDGSDAGSENSDWLDEPEDLGEELAAVIASCERSETEKERKLREKEEEKIQEMREKLGEKATGMTDSQVLRLIQIELAEITRRMFCVIIPHSGPPPK
jgi:ElaB/YqjD/DUF883 family membrane-anchored ribosome-binding protein